MDNVSLEKWLISDPAQEMNKLFLLHLVIPESWEDYKRLPWMCQKDSGANPNTVHRPNRAQHVPW